MKICDQCKHDSPVGNFARHNGTRSIDLRLRVFGIDPDEPGVNDCLLKLELCEFCVNNLRDQLKLLLSGKLRMPDSEEDGT